MLHAVAVMTDLQVLQWTTRDVGPWTLQPDAFKPALWRWLVQQGYTTSTIRDVPAGVRKTAPELLG